MNRAHCLKTAVLLIGICGIRFGLEPVQAYGDGGAHFREHALRLELLNLWHSCSWPSSWDFLISADQELHPPLLHILTSLVGSFVGHAATAVLWTGMLWWLLLAAALGIVAMRVAGRSDVAWVAATACLLLPAAHASATRYYYDLPLTAALWSTLAILALGADRRPVLAGIGAGFALLAAILIKWAALPFGVLMAIGMLCSRTVGSAKDSKAFITARMMAGLGLFSVLVSALLAYIAYGPSSLYSGALTFGSEAAIGALAPIMEALPRPLRPLGVSMTHELSSLNVARVAWYPLAMVGAVLSPAWCAVLVVPALSWLRGARGALPLIAWTVLGHLAFLIATMSLRDERFLLPLAPALVLACALGWAQLPLPTARRVAIAGAVVGLLVAADFHLGPAAPWNAEIRVFEDRSDVPPVGFRGLGLAGSFEQRGWSRRDARVPVLEDGREAAWDAVAACGAAAVGVHGTVFSQGGALWLRYRAALAEVRGEGWTGGLLAMTPPGTRLGGSWSAHPDNGWSRELAHRASLDRGLRQAPALPPPGEAGLSLEERRHLLAARLAPACESLQPSRISGTRPPDGPLGPPQVVLSTAMPPPGWVTLRRIDSGSGAASILLLGRNAAACGKSLAATPEGDPDSQRAGGL